MDLETKQYIETLDLDALARWMCLLEGIDFIFEKLEDDEKSDDYLFRSKKSFNILDAITHYFTQSDYLFVVLSVFVLMIVSFIPSLVILYKRKNNILLD